MPEKSFFGMTRDKNGKYVVVEPQPTESDKIVSGESGGVPTKPEPSQLQKDILEAKQARTGGRNEDTSWKNRKDIG